MIYYGLRELTEIIEIFSPINKLVNISRLRKNIKQYMQLAEAPGVARGIKKKTKKLPFEF